MHRPDKSEIQVQSLEGGLESWDGCSFIVEQEVDIHISGMVDEGHGVVALMIAKMMEEFGVRVETDIETPDPDKQATVVLNGIAQQSEIRPLRISTSTRCNDVFEALDLQPSAAKTQGKECRNGGECIAYYDEVILAYSCTKCGYFPF